MRVSSIAYLSAVDHEAKVDSSVRVGTSSESFGSVKLVAEKHFEVTLFVGICGGGLAGDVDVDDGDDDDDGGGDGGADGG
ncbi:hypothetical protein N7527_001628 [Penicillium freii]|nr:hypothetical protein N7527_001628 [Penicillium freii]